MAGRVWRASGWSFASCALVTTVPAVDVLQPNERWPVPTVLRCARDADPTVDTTNQSMPMRLVRVARDVAVHRLLCALAYRTRSRDDLACCRRADARSDADRF